MNRFAAVAAAISAATLSFAYVGAPTGARLGSYPFGATNPSASAPAIQSLTNAQKLSLPANTPVGTKVQVTDGFVVSGTGIGGGPFLFVANGTQNGKSKYSPVDQSVASNVGDCTWLTDEGGIWAFQFGTSTNSTADYPWEADWTGLDIVFTHPAVQQLVAPSTAQGGVFVLNAIQNGIYKISGTNEGKPFYKLLGFDSTNTDPPSVLWSNNPSSNFGYGPSSPAWVAMDDGFIEAYYSSSNVATPDLATNWKNASDDSPASITVTSVTQGELDAGVTVAGAGMATSNGVFMCSGSAAGLPKYMRIGHPLVEIAARDADDVQDTQLNDGESGNSDGEYVAGFELAWVAFWDYGNGPEPAPTVTRNDVASEANWQVVP